MPTCTSKKSVKCSVDYLEQREALCRLVYAATRARSTFSLGIHIPALSGSCLPFTRYSTPSLVTRWPTTTTLSSLAADDYSVDTPGSLPFALSTLLPSFCFLTESNHCNKEALSWSCSVTVVFGFWHSAVQRKRTWPLLVDLSHFTNFNTLSLHLSLIHIWRCRRS